MFGLMTFYGLYRPQLPDPIHGFIIPLKLGAGRVYITQYEESLENYILVAGVVCAFLAVASELNQTHFTKSGLCRGLNGPADNGRRFGEQ